MTTIKSCKIWRIGLVTGVNSELFNYMKQIDIDECSVSASTKLCGIIFVLLIDTHGNLNNDLSLTVKIAMKNRVRVIGMLAGLLQLSIEDESQAILQNKCKKIVDDVMLSIQERGITVWTIQQCSVGSWGDESWRNYGIIIPNLQQIKNVFGSASPGNNIQIKL